MKKILLGIGFISFCLAGCQTNEVDKIVINSGKVQLTAQELLSIECKILPELSHTELYDLIKVFQTSISADKQTTKSEASITSFEIRNKYYLSSDKLSTKAGLDNEKEQIPIYEIGFYSNGQKGMAVVSGDRRSPHVLAIIDKIKEDEMDLFAGPNALIEWAEMYVRNEVETFEVIKDSVYVSAVSKIEDGLGMAVTDISYENVKDKIILDNPQTRSTPIDEVPSNLKVNVAVFPMCPSTWDQWEPYNCKMPIGNCEKFFPGYVENTNYPTGIGTVTLAHLLACIRPGSVDKYRVDWASLTENKEIKAPDYFNPGDSESKRNSVGSLFKQIYTQTKSVPVKNSQGVVTGISCTVPNWEGYLRTVLDCGSTSAWNKETIINSLKNIRPVYVSGKPDNKVSEGVYPFILDGYKECFGRINNVPQDINVKYIHANFGFGGGYQDGYYLMDVNSGTMTFETAIPLIFKDNALSMIPDIRKKSGNRSLSL